MSVVVNKKIFEKVFEATGDEFENILKVEDEVFEKVGFFQNILEVEDKVLEQVLGTKDDTFENIL